MTNNIDALNGALTELSENMTDNLTAMGILDADASDGLSTLSGHILDIEPSVSGLNLATNISIHADTEYLVGQSALLYAELTVTYDDETATNVDLSGVLTGATVVFKNGNTVLGTATTDINGIAYYTHTFNSSGSYNISASFAGTDNFNGCDSNTVNITVHYKIEITSDADIISSGDVAHLTATLLDNNNAGISGETLSYEILDKDDNLLGSGEDITDSNGNITFSYTGTAVGDVSVIAYYGMIVSETYELQDYLKYIESGTYTGTSTISFKNLYEISSYTNIEISATIKAPNKGFSFCFLKSMADSSSIQRDILSTGVDGGGYITVFRDENGSTTNYTTYLYRSYTPNTELNCLIRIENGVVTLGLNDLFYTSTPVNGLKYVGIRNWNNAKTVTYTNVIVKPL